MRTTPVRIGQMIKLRPEKRDDYIALHVAVWPGVLRAIKAAHIRNYSIFLREPEMLLLAVYEYWGEDYQGDMKRMAENPAVQKWWTITDACQVKLSSATAEEWWVGTNEVFFHP